LLDPDQAGVAARHLLSVSHCRLTPSVRMTSDESLGGFADPPLRREETLQVAMLLALAGGYLDAYTWIVHKILANAQTANLVFLWVDATAGRWANAFHYVPSILAFATGVLVASYLRGFANRRAGEISVLVEIVFLIFVAILHNRLPAVGGTLGISFVAALQTASFPKVERWAYSSVMATSNFRQAVEGLFTAIAGTREPGGFRRAYVFAALCTGFGTGAAIGAFVTERMPVLTLGIPVALLMFVLLRCEATTNAD
jgi:uncharacterized membrane protein YoaK (UPF0700 family)